MMMVPDKLVMRAKSAAGQDSMVGLSGRAVHLFRALVEEYIEYGHAVSSRALVRSTGISLSAATVRNVMADLEELGLIWSAHTSAGRVPTVKGYRFFVNYLMQVTGAPQEHVDRLTMALAGETNTRSLLVQTSGLLSQITRMAGIVMVPKSNSSAVKHVEFIPVSDNRILMILVHSDCEVQNRILRMPRPLPEERLREISRAINSHLTKHPSLAIARDSLLSEMRSEYNEIKELMGAAVNMVDQRKSDFDRDYVMAGESNLMAAYELADMDKLRNLFDSFSRKNEMLELLDRAVRARGVQIFIGEESGYEALKHCSVVTSSYDRDGMPVGVVGVIGPTRMRYNDVVPVVNLAARTLGDALSAHQ